MSGSKLWCLIDALGANGHAVGAIGPTTRVGGLPLVCRQLRMAAAQGWRGARVLCPDRFVVRDVERAVAEAPPPPGFPVEVGVNARGDPPWVPLDARALYSAAELAAAARDGRHPRPLLALRSPADVAAGEARLYESLRKSIEMDGVVAYYVKRPLARMISRALLDTRVTANQVTVANLVLGLFGALLAACGGAAATLAAAAIFWAGGVIDCVDGDLARLRVDSSPFGALLDIVTDDAITVAMIAGLGIGLARDGAGPGWAFVGLAGAALATAIRIVMYADLHRMRLPIDTALYPWFFLRPRPHAAPARRGLLARAGRRFGYLLRRDAYVTLAAAALCFGLRRLTTVGLIAGNLAVGPVLLLHHVVLLARARRAV